MKLLLIKSRKYILYTLLALLLGTFIWLGFFEATDRVSDKINANADKYTTISPTF